jgi:hypothetical protein
VNFTAFLASNLIAQFSRQIVGLESWSHQKFVEISQYVHFIAGERKKTRPVSMRLIFLLQYSIFITDIVTFNY